MQKARRHPEGLRPLVSARFQLSFTPLDAVVFIVQSPYLFTIGHQVVFSLGGWTPHLQSGFPEPESNQWAHQFPTTGLSPSSVAHSNAFVVPLAYSLSLAATHEIAVAFFSCRY